MAFAASNIEATTALYANLYVLGSVHGTNYAINFSL